MLLSKKSFKSFLNAIYRIRSIGSAALSLAFLARGAVDCVHIDDLKAWDILAGLVIVNEAGGAVLDTKGMLICRTHEVVYV